MVPRIAPLDPGNTEIASKSHVGQNDSLSHDLCTTCALLRGGFKKSSQNGVFHDFGILGESVGVLGTIFRAASVRARWCIAHLMTPPASSSARPIFASFLPRSASWRSERSIWGRFGAQIGVLPGSTGAKTFRRCFPAHQRPLEQVSAEMIFRPPKKCPLLYP